MKFITNIYNCSYSRRSGGRLNSSDSGSENHCNLNFTLDRKINNVFYYIAFGKSIIKWNWR